MKKLLFNLSLVVSIFISATYVNAQTGFRISVSGGRSYGNVNSKDSKQTEAASKKAILDMPFPPMIQPANGDINVPVIPQFLIGTVEGGYTYYVEVATDSEFYNIISDSWETFSAPTNANSQFIFYHGIEDPNNYTSGTTYYWRVMVEDSSGQNSSGWSLPYVYTTLPPAAPVGTSNLLLPANYQTVSWTNVAFNWSPAPGATSYQLQWTDNSLAFSGFGTYNYNWLPGGQTSDTVQLSSNTTYYWRVIGYNNGTVGQFSSVGTFYTGNQTILIAPSGTFGIGPDEYTNGLDIQWLIEPPTAKQIKLSFSSFSTINENDYVTIYDGATTNSPILGEFTGNTIPQPVVSSSGVMLVEFTTGYYGTAQGWTANYTSSVNPGSVHNVTLSKLIDGPNETTYNIPQNSIGYVYFNMMSEGDSVSYGNSFLISLKDQSGNIHEVNAILIRPGILRISIPSTILPGNGTITYSLSDTITVGNNAYTLSTSPPSFQVMMIPQECSRTIDMFAEGSAGISGIIGGVGIGASIAAAKLSISGTGGMGMTLTIDQGNNLTLSRRLDFGLASSLKVPSIDFVAGNISALTLEGTAKAVLSQDISFSGMTNVNSNEKEMAEAGFVLETLSMGFTNFSPIVGRLVDAINQTLIGNQVSQAIDDAIIKTSWGEDFEGGISAGFGGTIGPIKLTLASSSLSGVFSTRVNNYPKGLQNVNNILYSRSFTEASNFDFSILKFSLESDNVTLSTLNKGLFDVGVGMESGAEAFFTSNGQLNNINLWLDGGGNLSLVGETSQTYYKTVIEIPGVYQSLLIKDNFGAAGLINQNTELNLGNLVQQMPAIIDSVSYNFKQTPIRINTYEDDGHGYDFNFGIDLDGALGVGLGLSFGFDTKYYDGISFVKKSTSIYANKQSYLLYSSNYPSSNLNDFSLNAFYNDLFTGAVQLAKVAFLNLIKSITQVVSAGVNTVVNAFDQTGNYIGGLVGSVESDGQWVLTTFSAAFPHFWTTPFNRPSIRNIYYSTRILHKRHLNKTTTLVQVPTTMVAVSNDMKVSFIPTGQSTTVQSINNPFKIKMLIDPIQLTKNGFSLADTSRIKIYRYDDPSNSWILEGGVLKGDTVETMVKHMSNYILGIELTSSNDTIPPDIYEYGHTQDTLTNYPVIYAKIKDNQYGVGVDWTKTYLIANGDTLNSSFEPADQMIFYKLSSMDGLSGKDIKVIISTSDYNNNTTSCQFEFTFTNVKNNNTIMQFSLSPNYPNPFNPTTKIDFSVAKQSYVTITIFNSIGQYVTTLINKEVAVGDYTVEFNGSRLASGVYFYSLLAKPIDGSQEYRETRKMVLVK